MLGISRQPRAWRWHAVGKHPAAADYIHLRGGPPILDAVADWMAQGYAAVQQPGQQHPAWHSWRCWLQGTQRERLICGVLRDSSDRIGRPYPLLIIGEGPLPRWEQQWPLLPVRLTPVWARIEQAAARKYDNLQALAETVAQLEGPPGDGESPPLTASIPADQLTLCQANLDRDRQVMIGLNDAGTSHPDTRAAAWHMALGQCCPDIPRAVFMGGTPQRAYLAVMRQPLGTADFVRLWQVDGKD